jgi:methylenetetrahydrofolate dehydrogenase (NAD+)
MGAYNKFLEEGNRLHGKTITIINRSEVVGRPLAALLANDGALVYSVDENGILEFHRGSGLLLKKHQVVETQVTLKEALKLSDIVIGGVPSPNYKIQTSDLKEGVIAINFSSFKNFEEDIKTKASIYVPSIGKVTITMLQRNLLRLYDYQKQDAQ